MLQIAPGQVIFELVLFQPVMFALRVAVIKDTNIAHVIGHIILRVRFIGGYTFLSNPAELRMAEYRVRLVWRFQVFHFLTR